MNAFDRAMKEIEKLIARGKPAKRQAPARKRRTPPARKVRVSRAERRNRISAGLKRRNAPNESALVEAAPTPPEAPGLITPVVFVPEPAQHESTRTEPIPPAPVPVTRPTWADAFERSGPRPAVTASAPSSSAKWTGTCGAVDADTGRTCKLPAHPGDPDRHRHERGPFFRVAAPGRDTFLQRRQMLDEAAVRSVSA